MLAVLLATMLSAGSAYADPDQPSTDPSGGTATGSTSQPAAGSKAGTGPVCTRHAEAITSATDSLAETHATITSLLAQQDEMRQSMNTAQLELMDVSDPADFARGQARINEVRADIAEMNNVMSSMLASTVASQAELQQAMARNVP